MRIREEEGQATVLVVVAMGIFLLGAVGLAVDGSNLFWQRQMAQTAADAAAQAGMDSIFNSTNGSGTTQFPTTAFTCTGYPNSTPCVYVAKNGFGTANDTVAVSFPTSAPGVALADDRAVTLMQVTISRNVRTTLMRLLGPNATTVQATATAAIVGVFSPIPIVVLHPWMSGAWSQNGGITVTVCGGPGRSVQVNSTDPAAVQVSGTSGVVNLSHAGPLDSGNCVAGTGADFGVKGGPRAAPFTFNGGTKPGVYRWKQSVFPDPLLGVSAPVTTGFTTDPLPGSLTAGSTGFGATCPASAGPAGCTVLSPGTYSTTSINLTNTTALFKPGIYYIQNNGGFSCASNCNAQMVTGTADPATPTGTGTGWNGTASGGGMLVYNTGTGQFSITSNGSVDLIGSPGSSSYKGILFFEDRAAAANNSLDHPKNPHRMGGNGSMILQGTIYLTNAGNTTSARFQELDLQGTSGGNTQIQGEIIVDALNLGGNGAITMNLSSLPAYVIDQVALVN